MNVAPIAYCGAKKGNSKTEERESGRVITHAMARCRRYVISNGDLDMAQQNQNTRGDQGHTGQSERGFASMDEQKQRDIASKGGQSQGKENNPGNFANDREKASEAGRKGGQS